MTEPATAAVVTVFLGSLFAGFYLLARALPARAYWRVARALAVGPAALWAVIGLMSSKPMLIAGFALALAAAVLALSWLAARVEGGADK